MGDQADSGRNVYCNSDLHLSTTHKVHLSISLERLEPNPSQELAEFSY